MTYRETDEGTDDASAQLASFVEFCKRVVRFWKVPLVVLLAGVVAGAVYLFIRKPAYRSETVILYSEGVRPPDDEDRPENARVGLESTMPLTIDAAACSRMPKCSTRPYGLADQESVERRSGAKDFAVSMVVLFEPARSAEPPQSSGSSSAIALMTLPDAARVA